MPNYLPFQGAENVSVPDDLNGEMPVQRFAFGGIANPSQQAFLSKADRGYLEEQAAKLEQYEKDRLAYNAALEKYKTEVADPYEQSVNAYNRAAEAWNTDVYKPYEQQYAAYERAINTWNEGPRTTDYAGPSEPTLSPFTMTAPTMPAAFGAAKPVVPVDMEKLTEFQKAAAQRAQEAAGQRGLAIDVVSDPGRYNLGALSVSNAFMAEGGEVKAKDMLKRVAKAGRKGDTKLAYVGPEARAMLKSMGGSGTVNPRTGLPEYALGNMASDFRAIAAQPPPPPPPPPPQPAPEPAPARSRGSSLGGLSRFSRVASSTPAPSQRSMKTFDARYLDQAGRLSAQEDSLKQQLANPAGYGLAAGDLKELESRLGGVQQQRGNLDAEMQMRMANAARLAQEAKPGSSGDLLAKLKEATGRAPTQPEAPTGYMQVVVYGPDGKMYGSPRAARDAGVTNYTLIPPDKRPVKLTDDEARLIDTTVGPPLPPPGGMPVFNPNDPFRDINNPRPVSPPPGGVLPGPVMGPPAPTPPAPAPEAATE